MRGRGTTRQEVAVDVEPGPARASVVRGQPRPTTGSCASTIDARWSYRTVPGDGSRGPGSRVTVWEFGPTGWRGAASHQASEMVSCNGPPFVERSRGGTDNTHGGVVGDASTMPVPVQFHGGQDLASESVRTGWAALRAVLRSWGIRVLNR